MVGWNEEQSGKVTLGRYDGDLDSITLFLKAQNGMKAEDEAAYF